MERYTNQLLKLKQKYDCPVLVAGDMFNHFNEPAELINFIIKLFRGFDCEVYAIPGQHDLFFHRLADIKRSAFWTLVESGVISYIDPEEGCTEWTSEMCIQGFPWGVPLTPCKSREKEKLTVAVIHRYVWNKGNAHPGAKEEDHFSRLSSTLAGFDVAVSGDNHRGFMEKMLCGMTVFNAGGFIRRKSDEINYPPQVGLIHESGKVTSHFLDTSEDVFLPTSELAKFIKDGVDMTSFLDELNALGDKAINFRESVENAIRSQEVREEVASIILKAMEGKS